MRIIAGHWKGKRLSRVPGSVRPTSDRLRESLFNVLGNRVEGSRWLDAFAGSGAVGLEALSRGAVFVLFNEKDRRVCEVVRHNLDICRRSDGPAVKGSYEVRAEDAFVLLRRVQAPVFDFVFLDPPIGFSATGSCWNACWRPLSSAPTRWFCWRFSRSLRPI